MVCKWAATSVALLLLTVLHCATEAKENLRWSLSALVHSGMSEGGQNDLNGRFWILKPSLWSKILWGIHSEQGIRPGNMRPRNDKPVIAVCFLRIARLSKLQSYQRPRHELLQAGMEDEVKL